MKKLMQIWEALKRASKAQKEPCYEVYAQVYFPEF